MSVEGLSLISSVVKRSACNDRRPCLILGWEVCLLERIAYPLRYSWASFVPQLVRRIHYNLQTWVRFLGGRRSPGGKGYPPIFWPGEISWTIVRRVTENWIWLRDFHYLNYVRFLHSGKWVFNLFCPVFCHLKQLNSDSAEGFWHSFFYLLWHALSFCWFC